jgi:hypothetical protein
MTDTSMKSPWHELFELRRAALSWLVGAVMGFAASALLLRESPLGMYVPFVVFGLMGVGYMRAGKRLSEAACPRCGGAFFSRPLPTPASRYVNPFASAPHCEHCGIAYLERVVR